MTLHPRPGRRGVILLAVLIVVTILALVSYSFFYLMTAEQESVQATEREAQLHLLADSGVHHVAFVLSYPQTAGLSDSDGSDGSVLVSPVAVFDNATAFNQVAVHTTNPRLQGYFSIVVPRDSNTQSGQSGTGSNVQGYRFGVEDESGKINVNALLQMDPTGTKATAILQALPNMTQDLANSMLNWTRPAGSSSSSNTASTDASFYASQGYTLKNGSFESQEELLLIRGMTPQLLLGNDLNRNGFLEPQEDAAGGVRDPGLTRYLTVYSRELNLNAQGQMRINVNDSDLQGLYNNLTTAVGTDLANFILAYRIYGPASGPAPAGGGGGPVSLTRGSINFQQGSNGRAQRISSLFDLVGATVSIRQQGARNPTIYRSPLQSNDTQTLRTQLSLLLDTVTTSTKLEMPSRINVNTAPQPVLAALPGMTDAYVQQILQNQPGQNSGSSQASSQASLYRTPVWLITEANLPLSLVKSIEPYITARSQVFRIQAIGYYEVGGPSVRVEAVIDTNRQHPRILYWRDITELGGAFGATSPRTMSR
jgi:type II secretory pathway component PulK